jgi:arylsulfatase A-like enzyme
LAPGRGVDQGFDLYSLGRPSRCGGEPRIRRRAGEVVDEALAWLELHDTEPFFVWLHLFDTHRPYDRSDNPNIEYLDPYLEAIAYEDAQIARMIAHLETKNLIDDTLIVVAGDHGESLGDHGEDGHGIFLYQETLRVPLILTGPGVPRWRDPRIVRLIDVTPTVLELFKLPGSTVDGVSFAHTANRRHSAPPLDVYSESMYPLRFGWAPLRALRADRYKLIDAPRPELYDLDADPGEQQNLYATRPAVAAAIRARLRSFVSPHQAPDDVPEDKDRAVLERLASLGYISGRPAAVAGGSASSQRDPKDHIGDFNTMARQHWVSTERRDLLCR